MNSLTQTVFYSTKLMTRQAHRMEYEFEKECVNQMARSTLRKYATVFDGNVDLAQTYRAAIKIGFGITYTKYNTLLHFLTVARNYWRNPDLSSLQLFGKDCRHVLGVLCQKICFDEGRDFYHYGPLELPTPRRDLDLAVGNPLGDEGLVGLSGGPPPAVPALTANKHLTELDLRDVQLSEVEDFGIRALSAMLQTNTVLSTIDLRMNQLGDLAGQIIIQALPPLGTASAIKYVHLSERMKK